MAYFSDLDTEETGGQQTQEQQTGNELTLSADETLDRVAALEEQTASALPKDVESGEDSDEKKEQTEAERRRLHEEKEAQRKAEWEARQAAKKAAEDSALAKIATMSDKEVMAAASSLMGEQAEPVTRRTFADMVMEYIQTKCLEDPAFARLAMNPKKSMARCFAYVFRLAQDYTDETLKAKGISVQGFYCGALEEGICYEWAEEYFYDDKAIEDQEQDEDFVPNPYHSPYTPKKRKPKAVKEEKPTPKKTVEKKATPPSCTGQVTLGDFVDADAAG